MHMTALIVFLLLFNSTSNDLGFVTKFRDDQKILSSAHYLGNLKRLNEFKQFTSIDLTKYRHASSISGTHTIDRWTSANDNLKEIVRVITVVPIDTVITEKMVDGTITDRHHIKTSFEFTTYQFLKSSKAYTYLTISHEGLVEYGIGKEIFNISYESIPLGLSEIYLKTKRDIKGILNKK